MNNDGLWNGYNNAAINPTGLRMNNNGMNMNMNSLNLMNAPVYRVTRVHGTQGVNELRMAPDCEGLFADETAPIIWHVKTDGAGNYTNYDNDDDDCNEDDFNYRYNRGDYARRTYNRMY